MLVYQRVTTISHHFCWSIPGEITIEPIEPPSDSPCTTTVTALSRGRAFGAISHPSHIPCNAKEGLVSRKLSHIKLLMTYPIKLTINVISISENVVFSLQNRWIVDHSYSWRFPMTVRLSYGMSKFQNWLQQCKLNTSTHQGSFWNWWNFYPFISSLCYFHLISRASFWCSTTWNSNTSKTWGERQTNLGRGRLVVSTPLKNISQLGVIISNIYIYYFQYIYIYMWKNKKCSKPPTSRSSKGSKTHLRTQNWLICALTFYSILDSSVHSNALKLDSSVHEWGWGWAGMGCQQRSCSHAHARAHTLIMSWDGVGVE